MIQVILDNGHGQETAGKRSPVWADGSQLFEYEFNRDIVRRIKAALPEVHILVPETIDVSLKTRVDRCNALAKSLGPANCLLISVHANAGGGTGWEAYTSVGDTKSDHYATMLYHWAAQLLPDFREREDLSDNDPDKEAHFYILDHTSCPAVLTENLFMDTEKDCKFLMSEEGRQAIANIHIKFIQTING